MTRWLMALSFVAMTMAAAAGCSSSIAGGSAASTSCSATVPSSCPTTTPSYKTDVAPLIASYCVSCHQAGGQESDKSLDTYRGVLTLASDVEAELGGCTMPPSSDSQPTDAERLVILNWLVCGAPDN